MNKSNLQLAREEIIKFFDQYNIQIYRYAILSKLFSDYRNIWKLAKSTTVNQFINFMIKETKLKKEVFDFPNRKETLYSWGEVPIYKLLQAVKENSFFSHYSATYLNNLTDQIPKTVYINVEQSPKPSYSSDLIQKNIDIAFSNKQRISKNFAIYKDIKIYNINGKHTNNLGVEEKETEFGKLRITNIERTLIDIVVRPVYSGGIFEVRNTYQNLNKIQFSIDTISSYLRKMSYSYPYHQAIGFLLDITDSCEKSHLEIFRNLGLIYDFYLMHNMKEMNYSKDWRLFFPKNF